MKEQTPGDEFSLGWASKGQKRRLIYNYSKLQNEMTTEILIAVTFSLCAGSSFLNRFYHSVPIERMVVKSDPCCACTSVSEPVIWPFVVADCKSFLAIELEHLRSQIVSCSETES